MKNSSGLTQGPSERQNHANKILYKCQKERNSYIRREVSSIIKKEISIMLATKKMSKDIQQHQKQVVYQEGQTSARRLQGFRHKQKENQVEKLKLFKSRNQDRMKRLAAKFQQQSMQRMSKSNQNFHRSEMVRQRYQKNIKKQQLKTEELKNSFESKTPLSTSRSILSNSSVDRKINFHIQKARELSGKKQSDCINNYLSRMRVLDQSSLKKELKIETKKSQNAKTLPKFNVSMRAKREQQMVNSWTADFEKRIQRFETNRQNVLYQTKQKLIQKSTHHQNNMRQVLQRKFANDEESALERIKSMREKIVRIQQVHNKRLNMTSTSGHSLLKTNLQKQKDEMQIENHSLIMKKVYQIVQKLKKLKASEQLSEIQIKFLMKNIDSSDNSSEFKEISKFLNSTKQKFLEQKRKQDEQRGKKTKKTNTKML